ncbi:MAG TPA: Crp/Fnr family transcriptional regulator [Bryobacteraceae bacterium]|nr:Crp/Fnr family transcriptional regulator [Bryobacteraceae bacterium]
MNSAIERERGYDDPLTYLTRKPIQEFPKRRVIYDRQRPCGGLYLVMLGRVKITSMADDGFVTVRRIVCAEGLFGEFSLVGAENRMESAVTLDDSTIMSWTRAEIEAQIEREPSLGIALSQFLVRQCIALQDRIESMALYKTSERVMLALLQLADSVGSRNADGSMRIGSLTHHTISEYVGTSREIVTFQMNRLRRMGLLRYSRQYIDIYSQAIKRELREKGAPYPERHMVAAHGMAGAALF